jgi:hypothetical protein
MKETQEAVLTNGKARTVKNGLKLLYHSHIKLLQISLPSVAARLRLRTPFHAAFSKLKKICSHFLMRLRHTVSTSVPKFGSP